MILTFGLQHQAIVEVLNFVQVFNDNNIHFSLHPSSGLDMDGLGDAGTGGGQWLRDPNISNGSTKQQQQSRAPNARQIVLSFVEPPIHRPSKYKEFGLLEPRKQLSIKVMEQFNVFRGQKNHVDGVWCKWCGNLYAPNITHLTQLFTSEFAPRQRGNMKLPAFRREGSNRHIAGRMIASVHPKRSK
ncbi:hypothetical protein R1flu_023966 [Riccia fluitans]|uniref:Uncharacterized protein n=1 Tax=Riccia fluitans TaxID=41844 RepID=A0ABD1XTJ0_9MARC